MRRKSFLHVVLWSLSCCAIPRELGADVLVVDASSDGDVILVKSGVYAPFGIVTQELTVAADTGADVLVMGHVTVAHTLVDHEVVLIGLRVHAQNLRVNALQDALILFQAHGPVRLERCELRGAVGGVHSPAERGGDALRATVALDVSLAGCSLQGGLGGESFNGFDTNRGGDGIRAEGSRIAVHDSVVRGGMGGERRQPDR